MQPDPMSALDDVARLQATALRDAVPTQRQTAWVAVWAGLLAASSGSLLWPVVLVVGIGALLRWRYQAASWQLEVHSRAAALVVLVAGLLVGAAYIAAAVAAEQGLLLVPSFIGLTIGGSLYLWMERAYAPLR